MDKLDSEPAQTSVSDSNNNNVVHQATAAESSTVDETGGPTRDSASIQLTEIASSVPASAALDTDIASSNVWTASGWNP